MALHTPPSDSTYRKDYERGWTAWKRADSSSRGGALDRADARNESEPFYDAYYDRGAGRDKYHSYYCRLAGGCEEHTW